METTTKEQILKKIRNALMDKPLNPFQNIDVDSSILQDFTDDIDVVFATQFVEMGGKFAYFSTKQEAAVFLDQLLRQNHWDIHEKSNSDILELQKPENILAKSNVWITDAEALIARNSSVLIAKENINHDNTPFDAVITIATIDAVVKDISDAIAKMKEKQDSLPQMMSFVKPGESKISKKIYVLLIEK